MNATNSFRILAQDAYICNDTWKTGLNNNDLIIGPSGAGKTRNYVKPNLMQCNESVIVTDTKGSLLSEVGPLLEKHGYKIINIDFSDMRSSYGYNPLDYIRYDAERGKYSEQDIMSVAACLVPIEDPRQAIWEYHARTYLSVLIASVLETALPEERTLKSVVDLLALMDCVNKSGENNRFDIFMEELERENPDSFAVRMYTRPEKVNFASMGTKKTAVFLNVSDTDRSCDRLVNLFYTQALQALCSSADHDYPDHRLPVPVRLILDDFAANAEIPDFDKITSVIRSREIYVSIILQSLSQLNSMYGKDKGMTITNNCDHLLYLGGQDVDTAQYIAVKANKTVNTILEMPLGDAYLFSRGEKPRKVRKYDIRSHERYHELPEAAAYKAAQPVDVPCP